MLRRAALVAMLALCAGAPVASAKLAAEAPVGPFAYHPWHFAGALPDKEPQTVAVPYDGPPLVLRGSYVHRQAAEPTMGVDKDGVGFYAASAFDAFGENSPVPKTIVLRSTDNGISWKRASPQVVGADTPPTTLDPYVYVEPATGRVFSIDLAGAGSYLSYSDDKGATWNTSAMTAVGANDHQTFFAGPPPAGNPLITTTLNYPDVVYYCVNAVTHVACSYSSDGGQSFDPVASPPYVGCVGCQTGHGVVDSKGRVFLPRGGIPDAGDPGYAQVAVSSNGGLSWSTVDVARAPLTSSRHTSIAVDRADNLYYVWWDFEQKLPYLSVSKDHGATWSKPLMIAPPGVHDTNFPVVTAGEPGRIAVTFPGSSVDDQGDTSRPWHAWALVSTNALDADPLFVANIADNGSDPLHRGACDNRCAGMYDFIDVQVSPKDGTFWGTFTDTCTDSNKCSTVRDPDKDLATDMQGLAVIQLFGPRLVGPPLVDPSAPTKAVVGTSPTKPRKPDHVKPRLRPLRVTVSKAGATRVAWRASEPSSVVLNVRRGKRLVASQQTGRPALKGVFSLGGLKPGRYRVTLVPTDRAGNHGAARTLSIKVRGRR